jgi:hypothetical protein
MEKFLVLTYQDEDQDHGEPIHAELQGQFDQETYPIRFPYWHYKYLIIPSWFDTEPEAKAYIDRVAAPCNKEYALVQVFRYMDERIGKAKIQGILESIEFYPRPGKGHTPTSYNGKVTEMEVWTMFLCDLKVAKDLVKSMNDDFEKARNVRNAG